MMPGFTIQNIESMKRENTADARIAPFQHGKYSEPHDLDNKQSQIFATNCFVRIVDGKIGGEPKVSDDKIVIAYSDEGLPFQIIVDGAFGGPDTENLNSLIDQEVTPRINQCAAELAKPDSEQKVNDILKDTINDIYLARMEFNKNHNPGMGPDYYDNQCQFTMSVAMTYERNGEQYCAGFGIGDTGIALQRQNGQVEQLVRGTIIDDSGTRGRPSQRKVFFGMETKGENRDQNIERHDIVNVKINPGDQILGYTHIPDRMKKTSTIKDGKDSIIKESISLYDISSNTNLLTQVVDQCGSEHTTEMLLAQSESRGAAEINEGAGKQAVDLRKIGDDCTIGVVTMPDKGLQKTLQNHAEIINHNTEMVDLLQNRINELETKVGKDKSKSHIRQTRLNGLKLVMNKAGEYQKETKPIVLSKIYQELLVENNSKNPTIKQKKNITALEAAFDMHSSGILRKKDSKDKKLLQNAETIHHKFHQEPQTTQKTHAESVLDTGSVSNQEFGKKSKKVARQDNTEYWDKISKKIEDLKPPKKTEGSTEKPDPEQTSSRTFKR